MVDLRILALGAMALLMAIYGASSASGTSLQARTEMAMHRAAYGNPYAAHIFHVDGFDLRR